jgi:hypothetical protein
MINVIILIEKTADDAYEVIITKTSNRQLVMCIESVVFKIGDVFVFEPEVDDVDRKYIETLLINQ